MLSVKAKHTGQAGNAVLLILIGVALFGALAYTFMRGAKEGQGNMSTQQAKVLAGEILNYSRTVEQAVNKVRQKGCSETQISFEDTNNTGYVNAGTPSDGSCKIFAATGGQITFTPAPAAALDIAAKTASIHGLNAEWYFPGGVCVPTQGEGDTAANCRVTDKVELLIFLPFIKKEVCDQINAALNITTMPNAGNYTVITSANSKFTGAFVPSGSMDNSKTATACFNDYSDASAPGLGYHFYKVLIAR